MVQHTSSGKGLECTIVISTLSAVTTIAVVLRVYVRAFLIRNFGLDDWAAVVGWTFFVLTATFFLLAMAYGAGQHNDLVEPPENVSVAVMWIWMAEHAYVLSNMSVKLSIGLMLLRFIQDKRLRRAIWILLAIFQLFSIIYFIWFVLDCSPASYFWTRYRNKLGGHCANTRNGIIGTYFHSAVICIVDWTFAIIPWFLLRNVRLNRRTKIATACALSLGAIASVATIIRLPYVKSLGNESDYLYATTDLILWTFLEAALGLIASAATTFKPLLKKVLSTMGRLDHPNSIALAHRRRPKHWPAKHSYTFSTTEFSSTAKSNDISTSSEERQESLDRSTTARDENLEV